MFESPNMDNGHDSEDDNTADDDGYNAFAQQKQRKKMYHQQNQQSMAMLSDDSSSDDEDEGEDQFLAGDDVARPKSQAKIQGGKGPINKTTVWSGDPGSKAGHVAAHVSSYFSRLWKNGNKSRVWYLYLRKLN